MTQILLKKEMIMFRLDGQVSLITGASGGIGRSIAKACREQGAIVVLSGTRQEVLEKLAQELKTNVYILPCNLNNSEEIEDLIPQTEKQAGKIDILVNNAGITKDNLIVRLKDEDWDQVIQVNLTSAFRLSRAAVKPMMKQRYGRIINITSIVGVTGNIGQINYSASKAGLIGMSKSLAQEVASRNITVNCVAPGFIETSMTQALSKTSQTKMLEKIPMKRMGTPDEIAFSVVFLASREAQYITGQTLHINGGMDMR